MTMDEDSINQLPWIVMVSVLCIAGFIFACYGLTELLLVSFL